MFFERHTDLETAFPEVFRQMTSRSYQDEKAQRLEVVEHRCDITDAGSGRITVVSRRTSPAGSVPELIRAMVKPTLTVTETESWHAPDGGPGRQGDFSVQVSGAPIAVKGTVHLDPAGTGCRLTFEGELRTTVPLFRSAIESAASGRVIDTIEAEFALLQDIFRPGAATDGAARRSVDQ
ncbi:DUF2505 domain-containing protein [Kineosporia succinea]|uniref:DUF2505 domain-containing protein n=1 Tax=Kineosporia succinea TaxID=84632 RepID=A0ABT9PAG4_9ACTN|nr:DUF2505 domain-containing protein [Kineosporia succinea]MDP9829674.1 hypothetical protein [Kineosporia succinea]